MVTQLQKFAITTSVNEELCYLLTKSLSINETLKIVSKALFILSLMVSFMNEENSTNQEFFKRLVYLQTSPIYVVSTSTDVDVLVTLNMTTNFAS